MDAGSSRGANTRAECAGDVPQREEMSVPLSLSPGTSL